VSKSLKESIRESLKALLAEAISGGATHYNSNSISTKPILGDYVWPSEHSDYDDETDADIEKNTFPEDLLYDAMSHFLEARQSGGFNLIDPHILKYLRRLLIDGSYPGVFTSPDPDQFVYRGMVMDRRDFEAAFGDVKRDAGGWYEITRRNVLNKVSDVLNKLSKGKMGKGEHFTWDQAKLKQNNYTDSKFRERDVPTTVQERMYLDEKYWKMANSMWTTSLRSGLRYAMSVKQKMEAEGSEMFEPVIFVMTASPNTATFLDLDTMISDYPSLASKMKGTKKGESLLLGDAQVNNIYVFYNNKLSRKVDPNQKTYRIRPFQMPNNDK